MLRVQIKTAPFQEHPVANIVISEPHTILIQLYQTSTVSDSTMFQPLVKIICKLFIFKLVFTSIRLRSATASFESIVVLRKEIMVPELVEGTSIADGIYKLNHRSFPIIFYFKKRNLGA